MRRALVPALLAFFCVSSGSAFGGAWTLDKGQIQIISSVLLSRAGRSFDDTGNPTQKVSFDKLFTQTYLEYGLSDDVTLFVAPEYVSARSQFGGDPPASAHGTEVEGGARILLFGHIGRLSLQGSAKTAGMFDMYYAGDGGTGRRLELRLLYGTKYKLLGDNGFVDLQLAQRWISRPRPDETAFDATAGLWLRPATLLMLQSFNTFSGGGGEAPYLTYRQHKLELSLVEQITERWSLQLGAFMSPAGRNIIEEQGIGTAVWVRY